MRSPFSLAVRYHKPKKFLEIRVAIRKRETMQVILLSREEVAKRARQLYENNIRQQVEVDENIGKMVIIKLY